MLAYQQWNESMVNSELLPNDLTGRISRRRVLALWLASASLAVSRSANSQAPSRTLNQPSGIEKLQTLLKMELEVEGEVRLAESRNPKSDIAPIKSKSNQEYLEVIAYRDNQPEAAARRYLVAQSENWVLGKSVVQKLRSELADTRVMRHDGTWEQYCPAQPIERREVDLLRCPINSLALEKLLSVEPARADSKWAVSSEDARDLFNLDAVHSSTLTVKVVGVEKGIAKIELQGTLQASANSVATEIQIKGNAHVSMCSQCAFVSWLGVSIKENRQVSERQPGFSITARLQIIRQELKGKLNIDRDELLAAADRSDPSRWLVQLESRCQFRLLASRNWITYLDSGEDAVLRYVQNNKVIAQCDVSRLPALDSGTQLTLDGLQEEIRRSLGKRFGEFLESSERVTDTKLRLLRVEVSGEQEEVAIRWLYAHLSDDHGRRLAMVFTLAADEAEAFSGQDLQILDSLEFVESSAASSQTAAGSSPTAIK